VSAAIRRAEDCPLYRMRGIVGWRASFRSPESKSENRIRNAGIQEREEDGRAAASVARAGSGTDL